MRKLLSQSQNEKIASEDENLENFSQKGVALWYKGHQSIGALYGRLRGSASTLTTIEGERSALKTQKKVQKTKIPNKLNKSR
jgi:hypothetical protein